MGCSLPSKYQFRIFFILPGMERRHFLKAGWPVAERTILFLLKEGGDFNVMQSIFVTI